MKSLTGQQNSQALLGAIHLFHQHTLTVMKSYIVLKRTFKYSISYYCRRWSSCLRELTLLEADMEFVTNGTNGLCVKFVGLD